MFLNLVSLPGLEGIMGLVVCVSVCPQPNLTFNWISLIFETPISLIALFYTSIDCSLLLTSRRGGPDWSTAALVLNLVPDCNNVCGGFLWPYWHLTCTLSPLHSTSLVHTCWTHSQPCTHMLPETPGADLHSPGVNCIMIIDASDWKRSYAGAEKMNDSYAQHAAEFGN